MFDPNGIISKRIGKGLDNVIQGGKKVMASELSQVSNSLEIDDSVLVQINMTRKIVKCIVSIRLFNKVKK